MRIRYVLPALAVTAALALTGCVDNSTPVAETPGESGSASAIQPDAASVALLPDSITSAGKIILGTDAAYPPNEYKDSSGQPIGWEIELTDAMAAKLGVTAEYQIASFDNIIPSITGGKADAGISSFTDNAERQKQVDFVNYFVAGISWAQPVGGKVDPDNACGLTVAVQSTTYEQTDELPAKSDTCVAAGKAAINILPFDSQDLAASAVALGKADAMSADSPVTLYAIAQSDGKLEQAGETFEAAPYGMPVKKDSPLVKALQSALQSLVDDGTYGKILTKWGVESGALDKITINAGT